MQGYEVRLFQQLIERSKANTQPVFFILFEPGPAIINHLHVESAGPPGNRSSDPSKADYAKCFAAYILAEEMKRGPEFEFSVPGHRIAFYESAGCSKYQGESKVGSRNGKHSGGICYRNCPPGCCRNIDMVKAHSVIGNDFESGGSLEDLKIDAVGDRAKKPVFPFNSRQQLFPLDRRIFIVSLQGMLLRDSSQDFLR